jgi:hypothetical protein
MTLDISTKTNEHNCNMSNDLKLIHTKLRGKTMHEMTKHYLICALWSSTNPDNENEEFLDENYTIEDFAPEAIAKADNECTYFLSEHHKLIGNRFEQAGHDFWLTRNHHGCGFWEVPDWPKEDGKILTDAAHKYGELHIYIGDDNKLHFL